MSCSGHLKGKTLICLTYKLVTRSELFDLSNSTTVGKEIFPLEKSPKNLYCTYSLPSLLIEFQSYFPICIKIKLLDDSDQSSSFPFKLFRILKSQIFRLSVSDYAEF